MRKIISILSAVVISLVSFVGISNAGDSKKPIVIPTHNWNSQVVMAYVIGGMFESMGNNVEYVGADPQAVYEAIRNAGVPLSDKPSAEELQGQIVQIFAKAEAHPAGLLRGYRQVMLNDSDVHHHRQIKAAVGGVIAAAVADPAIFVSVAALHQGPPGGGPVAAIVELPGD